MATAIVYHKKGYAHGSLGTEKLNESKSCVGRRGTTRTIKDEKGQ